MFRRLGTSDRSRAWLAVLVAACSTDFSASTGAGRDGSVPEADGGGAPDGSTVSPACQEALAAASFDFESGPAGWTHDIMPEIAGTDVDWRFDDWQHGTASNVGPAACHAGTGCWATRLDNNYIACQRAYLMSPPLDLAACAGEHLALRFQHFHDFWIGEWDGETWFDGGVLELGDDSIRWAAPPGLDTPGVIAINPNKGLNECIESDSFHVDGRPGFVGQSDGWAAVDVAIPSELVTGSLFIRFAYSSGVILQSSTQNPNSFSNAGWYIDDLAVVARPP
ncbi:MAG TPA: hypothetical protein VFU21_11805 [Kofleriaceae bacterium]|nr:hypothetical protein [Kofleriaceae bacterium]